MYRDFFERLLRTIQTKSAWELHAAIRVMVEVYCLLSLISMKWFNIRSYVVKRNF